MALPNAKVMIHQAWTGGFQGPATDVQIRARELLRLQARLEELLAHHAGKPVEQVHEDVDRDNFLSADEARAYGLIDRVVSGREDHP
jgi:ATP-dependent Clp protease protease subunit